MIVGQFGSFIGGFLDNYEGTLEDGDMIFLSDPIRSAARSATRTTGSCCCRCSGMVG
jgi:hypothetical protein